MSYLLKDVYTLNIPKILLLKFAFAATDFFFAEKGDSCNLKRTVNWYFLDLHCTNNGFLVPKKNSEVVSEGEDLFVCVSHDCFRR